MASTRKNLSWSRASQTQIDAYTVSLEEKLQAVQLPPSLNCTDPHCKDPKHSKERDSIVLDLLCAMVEASHSTLPLYGGKGGGRRDGVRGTVIPGWNELVAPYQKEAKYWHNAWLHEGRPSTGWLHQTLVKKRSQYHYAIRRARRRSDLTRAEQLFEASMQGDCNLLAEMKKIRCGGPSRRPDLPDTVALMRLSTSSEQSMKHSTIVLKLSLRCLSYLLKYRD